VRADHLGLYGYSRATSPFLAQWSEDARVFEDALSPAGYTLPAHASMFTGLYPSEHCTHNDNARLDDAYVTIAEFLKGAGYRTFLYSANPHIAAHPAGNFAQGFDREEHLEPAMGRAGAAPGAREGSSRGSQHRAAGISPPPGGRTSLVPANIKAAGRSPNRHARMARGERREPALLHLPELHGGPPPYILPWRLRERLLVPRTSIASYRVDRSWNRCGSTPAWASSATTS
jgi:arylsulfatase A-like enzyme